MTFVFPFVILHLWIFLFDFKAKGKFLIYIRGRFSSQRGTKAMGSSSIWNPWISKVNL